jgi:hypothetical protein
MIADLEIINPLHYPGWDDLVLSSGKGSFFHSAHWAKVLHESYGYKPVFFILVKDKFLKALVPVMEINSPFTGKRGVSLPFTDYCEPIIPDGSDLRDIMDNLIQFGKKSGWKYIDMRSSNSSLHEFIPSSFYFGHMLELSQGDDTLYSSFRHFTRKNINKAEREKVRVSICNSLESIRVFYHLNCMTRKRHELPPQPFYFFKNMYEHIIKRDLGSVVLASHESNNIAASIFFHFGEQIIFKYGVSDKRYQHLRANNLMIWETIKHYIRKGYKSFCFGRTEPENEGLLQFKRGWGAQESIINYYKYDLMKKTYVQGSIKTKGWHNKVFAILPMPLLRLTGSLLYKHIG